MADDASSDASSTGTGSPLDDLEDDSLTGGGDFPFEGEDPFGGENPFQGDPFGGGGFGSEPPAVMMAKLWIRQNALLSVGAAFTAGLLIGVLQR